MRNPTKVSCWDCRFLKEGPWEKDDSWTSRSCSERPEMALYKGFPYKAVFCTSFVKKPKYESY